MIKGVRITADCIGCTACEQVCPQVFKVVNKKSSVLPGADLVKYESEIKLAAEGCPVEAIKHF